MPAGVDDLVSAGILIKNDLKQHIQKDQHHIVTKQHNENIGKDKHLNVSGNNSTNSSSNNSNVGGSVFNNQPSSSNMLGMTPIQPISIEVETVNIALTYEDIVTNAPVGGGIIEFGHNYNEASVENERLLQKAHKIKR